MSEWHEIDEDAIEVERELRAVHVFVCSNDQGSVNASIPFDVLREACAEFLLPQWQPIETAPRDGRELILSNIDSGLMVIGSYSDLHHDQDYPWWDGGVWRQRGAFTHWMPTPQPQTED